MSVIKRNLGLFVFGVCALAMAIVLIVFLQRYAARAADFEEKVERQRAFFRELKQRPVPVNQANLDVIIENYDLAQRQLFQLRSTLWNRSRILVDPVSRVQAKNILTRATRAMRRELETKGILVGEEAQTFGFNDILAAETLPEAEDVPIIMKQMEVVQEIVRLARNSYIDQFLKVERPMGLDSEGRKFFRITPFKITLQGKVGAVKELVTSLQADAQYLLTVQYLTVNSDNNAENLLSVGPGAEYRKAEAADRGERRLPAYFESMPGEMARDNTEEKSEDELPPKEARQIALQDVVKVVMRVDFLEFKEPEPEQE